MSDKIVTLKQKDTGDRLFPKTNKEAVIDLVIDQNFNGESTNPQSGVAIQQALNNLPDTNNGVLTIQKNNTNIAAFSANSSTDVLANITVPTKTSELTNDSLFIQNTTSPNQDSVGILGTITNGFSVSIGSGSVCSGTGTSLGFGIALGASAYATAERAIQIGEGENQTSNSLAVGFGQDSSLNNREYQLLDGTTGLIPDARLSSNIARASQIVNSDWNASSGSAEILNKPDLTVYEKKQKTINTLSTSGTITLSDNSINSITPSGNITFALPTITDNTVFHEIMVQINLSTVYTIDVGTTYYFNKKAPDLSTAGTYNLYYEYDKASQHWYCGVLSKGTAS